MDEKSDVGLPSDQQNNANQVVPDKSNDATTTMGMNAQTDQADKLVE